MTSPGWRALLVLEANLVDLHRDLGQVRRDLRRDSAMTDELAGVLELRVTALEELLYTRWPRSIGVKRRLRRDLRRSVAHVQGGTFAERRLETVGTGWIERRHRNRGGGL